jgi:ubiquinone/menaquinone biosynthesis C-methylase UbiE
MSKSEHAFVTFYSKHKISPVNQDLSDIKKHFQRRDSLFKSLGILPSLVSNSRIIEFGPGSGDNAVYTASLNPKKYVLVDGNQIGVEKTIKRLFKFGESVEVINKMFLEFGSSENFDIVWAEGCIPQQKTPITILKHLSTFTKKSGIFVCTTINSISWLSEIVRRLMYTIIETKSHINSIETALNTVRGYYLPHLVTLKNMSRFSDDWIIDNMIQPMHDRRLLSIPQVVSVLSDEFDVYASSPKFITDWRWYKNIIGENRNFNENALSSYYKTNLNLIDCRYLFKPCSENFGKDLEEECSSVWNLMCQLQKGDSSRWQNIFDNLKRIAVMIKPHSDMTEKAIHESISYLQEGVPYNKKLKYFPGWWGRGQQYLSLVRVR